MSKLKLAKLPDRTPVKLTVTISPELNRKLVRYTEMYNEAYGNAQPEPTSELVPYMLESFLDNDKDFVRAEKRARREGVKPSQSETSSPRTLRQTRGGQTAAAE
jgi:hypothetical protein